MPGLMPEHEVPQFSEFLEDLDRRLYLEIDKITEARTVFWYFAASPKTLSPREFLDFWGSLSEKDQHVYELYVLTD